MRTSRAMSPIARPIGHPDPIPARHGTSTGLRARLSAMRKRAVALDARWELAASALFVVISLLLYATCSSHNPASDGHYSWLYARSLAYDGDLDLTNDYALCGDPFSIGAATAAHRPANFFYFGPAVFWTPLVWILKHFVHGSPKWAGGCVGPIPNVVLAMSSLAGGAVVYATAALCRLVVRPKLAAFSALLATLGGHLIYFTGMSPSYSHAYDGMCIALFVLAVARLRASERMTASLLALAGLALGVAILQRASNGVFFFVAVLALFRPTWRAVRALLAIGLVASLSGWLPLLFVNRAIYGRVTVMTHGPHFLQLGHAHPLLLLFDQRGGLFPSAPLLWLAVPGLVMLSRKRDLRWLVAPLVFCGAFELYISSAALDWQGARRLVNLTPLFALALATMCDPVVRFLRAAPRRFENALVAIAVGAVVWSSSAVSVGFKVGKIPWDRPLTTVERFGAGGDALVDETESTIGPVTALPASWIFALRYDRKPAAFGWAAHPIWYARDMLTLEYTRNDFSFVAPESASLIAGFRVDDKREHACMTGTKASAVFAAQWPVATHARLIYDATQPETLAIASRDFFATTTPWNRIALAPGTARHVIVRIPRGGFDSGIDEIDFERDANGDGLCLRALELADATRYPTSPESQPSFPVIVWHALEYNHEGAAPAVAAAGATRVEAHESSRGTIISGDAAWSGFRPRVAAAKNVVVEVHQERATRSALSYRISRDGTWSPSAPFGIGLRPALAMSDEHVVEAHSSDDAMSTLSFRTASISGTSLVWNALVTTIDGYEPALAIAGSRVVEAHQKTPDGGTLVVRSGRVDSTGAITWSPSVEYGPGAFPSVAIIGETIVEVDQATSAPGVLTMRRGTFASDGAISWEAVRAYDHGARPSIAFDAATGYGFEAHEGRDTASGGLVALWERDLVAP